MDNYLKDKTKPPASKFPHGNVRVPQMVVTKANIGSSANWGTPPTIPALPYGNSQRYSSG